MLTAQALKAKLANVEHIQALNELLQMFATRKMVVRHRKINETSKVRNLLL